jgi:hypothetical protein
MHTALDTKCPHCFTSTPYRFVQTVTSRAVQCNAQHRRHLLHAPTHTNLSPLKRYLYTSRRFFLGMNCAIRTNVHTLSHFRVHSVLIAFARIPWHGLVLEVFVTPELRGGYCSRGLACTRMSVCVRQSIVDKHLASHYTRFKQLYDAQ